jgi:hypothetical protein
VHWQCLSSADDIAMRKLFERTLRRTKRRLPRHQFMQLVLEFVAGVIPQLDPWHKDWEQMVRMAADAIARFGPNPEMRPPS